MALPQLICANWKPDDTDCKKVGGYSCGNCFLVAYCGPSCQTSHWIVHKTDCRSPLGKKTWNPDWVLENRTPAFVREGIGAQFGGKKYLWGNIPAMDVLQLGSNEDADYGGQLHLLFAASGDFRNVTKTIAQLPSSYNQPFNVTMNDRDLDVVARNAIMLLIALSVDNTNEAIDCIIHVWYSAFIRRSDLNILQQRIRPLIESVCEKIKSKTPSSLFGKTWTFGQCSLRLVLQKSSWNTLLSFMNIPEGLTAERANQIRNAVTLAESRKDYRDRHFLFQSPSHRIAKNRFREDGLLLPFASPRHEFREPNPTLFQAKDTWPMHDNADPLNGWSLKEVEDTPSGPVTADIYGKLLYHVRSVLRAFVSRLSDLQISFRHFQLDASDLPDHLAGSYYDRIEVSNISDAGYLGIHRTIELMVPLLQGPLVNPHATLITLFMNAVDENTTNQDQIADMTPHSPTTRRLLQYLPPKTMPTNHSDPDLVKFSFARDYVRTYDHIFDKFVKEFMFLEAAQIIGTAMKARHTVVEKWPFRLKLKPGQPGAQEEFDRLLAGGVSGKERYVEWKRM